ncbi:hypothetical protein [Micromonospora coerulea]|uniref:hypothetical protein n=1 Tax=Micromonospora coerulea TaxID=47856 RepID=UPI001905081F|nr:hypothetical protein [Micromonospora veneta]
MDLRINPDDLTLGDLEDFEDFTGKSIDEAIKPVPVLDDEGKRTFDEKGRPEMTVKVSTKAIICLVWLTQRKANPDFTVADARNVKVTSLVVGGESEAEQGNG